MNKLVYVGLFCIIGFCQGCATSGGGVKHSPMPTLPGMVVTNRPNGPTAIAYDYGEPPVVKDGKVPSYAAQNAEAPKKFSIFDVNVNVYPAQPRGIRIYKTTYSPPTIRFGDNRSYSYHSHRRYHDRPKGHYDIYGQWHSGY